MLYNSKDMYSNYSMDQSVYEWDFIITVTEIDLQWFLYSFRGEKNFNPISFLLSIPFDFQSNFSQDIYFCCWKHSEWNWIFNPWLNLWFRYLKSGTVPHIVFSSWSSIVHYHQTKVYLQYWLSGDDTNSDMSFLLVLTNIGMVKGMHKLAGFNKEH